MRTIFSSVGIGRGTILLLLLLCSVPSRAEVLWTIDIGGMYEERWSQASHVNEFFGKEGYYDYDGSGPDVNLFAGLGLQIPVSSRLPLTIETGLRYRRTWMENKIIEKIYEENYMRKILYLSDEWGNMLDVPVKIGYYVPTSEKCGFNFSLGPRISYNFTPVEMFCWGSVKIENEPGVINTPTNDSDREKDYTEKKHWAIDLEPSVHFNYRAFRVGLYSDIPLYNPCGRRNSEWVTFSLGFVFNSGVWGSIGKGALVAGQVMGAVAEGYANAQNGGSGSSYYNNYSQSSTSGGSTNNGSNDEKMYYHWEKRAQAAYESLAGHSGSTSTYNSNKRLLREAQSQMRKYRTQARKKGINIPQSKWETATVKSI